MEKEEREHAHSAKHVRKPSGLGFTDKVFLILLVFSVIYIGYLYFQQEIVELLKMNPYVWAFFTHIAAEISKRTILGLFYACFFGSLFFIVLPIELIFLYYVALGYSVPLVVSLTLLGYLMGLCLDYLFGFVVGARVIRFFLREKFERFHKMIEKWGGIVVFVGSAVIFPIQLITVIVGSAKYSFKKFVIFAALGLFVKLVALVALGTHLEEYIFPIVQSLA